MSPEIVQVVPLILVAPLLAAMALSDLKHLKIPNRLVLAMLAIFTLSAPCCLSPQDIGHRAIAGVVAFALGLLSYPLRLWGGGDIKAIAVLVLFVPSHSLPLFACLFSASMAAGMALVLTTRAVLGSADSLWFALRSKAGYPMGVSIAITGLLLPLAPFLLAQ